MKLAFSAFFCCVAVMTAQITAPSVLATSALADSAEHTEISPFQPSEDAMADVDALLAQASAENKLAMIILGANWCHDSIGFIDHIHTAAVAKVISAKYVTKTIDVGFLEHGRDIMSRFGLKVIYGTPTVLIIEPTSGRLLNHDTLHQWRDAAAMKEDEVISLLASQQSSLAQQAEPTGELKRLLDEIDAFETAQAARIYNGFAVVGPMLAADERPADFGHYWGQLRDLRYSITEDLKRLREEAYSRTAAGETDIQLEYPTYPAFDWEQ